MKENILILGGYSKNNITWIKEMSNTLSDFYQINLVEYDNWYNDLEMNFDKEVEKIYKQIINNNITNVIAKSIGIYLVVLLLRKYNIKLNKIIVMGYPLKLLKEENIFLEEDIQNINKLVDFIMIQQDNDPLGSFDEITKLFNNINILKIIGNDHSYSNYNDIKNIIDDFFK